MDRRLFVKAALGVAAALAAPALVGADEAMAKGLPPTGAEAAAPQADLPAEGATESRWVWRRPRRFIVYRRPVYRRRVFYRPRFFVRRRRWWW